MRRLLIRPGALGDLIVSLPALESLRAGYTEVWTSRENCSLVRFGEKVSAIADTGLDLLGLPGIEPPASLLCRLRSFDHVVSWYGAHRAEVRHAMVEAQVNVTFFSALPPTKPEQHAVDFYLQQVRSVGSRPTLAIPRISCPWSFRRELVIHPFSGSRTKNWPLERFRQLTEHLRFPVHWVAGPEEPLEGATRFADRYDLACWLAGARLLIGNDSGVSHLAAAVGTPVLAIFGPTSPAIWQPRGPSVSVIRAHSGELADVTADEVVRAVNRLLE